MSSVLIALGSNLGDRRLHLRRAVEAIRGEVTLVRMSEVWETAPLEAPAGSGAFLNMVVLGWTDLGPEALMEELHRIEARMGRVRRVRNAPRTIDLDLLLHGAHLRRSRRLTVPHPRYRSRAFVQAPLAELALRWVDPRSGVPVVAAGAEGAVRKVGRLW